MGTEIANQARNVAVPKPGGDEISHSALCPDLFLTLDEAAKQTQPAIMLAAFNNVVGRLEQVLDLETEMLRQHQPIILHDFNRRKSQGLLELSRAMEAMRAFDPSAFEFGARAPLARLRAKLENNLSTLQTHLNAVGEIAAIIGGAIQDYESDGTYTARVNVNGGWR
jgi:hypothetical protein